MTNSWLKPSCEILLYLNAISTLYIYIYTLYFYLYVYVAIITLDVNPSPKFWKKKKKDKSSVHKVNKTIQRINNLTNNSITLKIQQFWVDCVATHAYFVPLKAKATLHLHRIVPVSLYRITSNIINSCCSSHYFGAKQGEVLVDWGGQMLLAGLEKIFEIFERNIKKIRYKNIDLAPTQLIYKFYIF